MPGDVSQLLVVAGIHFLAVLSPGPDMAVVLRNAFARGRRVGIAAAIGIGAGKAVHTAALLSGLGVAVAGAPRLIATAKIGTGCYLAYLGLRGLFARRRPSGPGRATTDPAGDRRGFLEGFVTSLVNPKGFLFFFAVFAGMIPESGTALMAVYLPVATGAIFVGIAVLATAGQRAFGGARWSSALGTVMGLVLVLIGAQLVLS